MGHAPAIGISILFGVVTYGIAYLLVRRVHFPEMEVRPPFRHLPQTVVSLEKAIKHLQRVHVVSAEDTHDQLGKILHEVKDLSKKMRKESSFSEKTSEYHSVEKMFVALQILTACFVAFAHGANDVANAIGPIAAVLDIVKRGVISEVAPIPSLAPRFWRRRNHHRPCDLGLARHRNRRKKNHRTHSHTGLLCRIWRRDDHPHRLKTRLANLHDPLPRRRRSRRRLSWRHPRHQPQYAQRHRPLLGHHHPR